MSDFTKKPLTDKEYKNLRIYNILREKEEVSRADLTAITSMSAVSVSNYANAFIKKKLLIEKEIGTSSGGRPPIILALNNKNACSIGLHVSRTSVSGVIVDLATKRVDSQDVAVSKEGVVEAIKKVTKELRTKVPTGTVKGIALSVEVSSGDIGDLASSMEEEFQVSVYMCSPAVSAAYAESVLRDRYSESRCLYSYGDIGECVFLENFEFHTWDKDTEANPYLRPWGVEKGIEYNAKRIIKEGAKTEILKLAKDSLDNITAAEVYKAAQKNDALAAEILEYAGLNLGVRLSYLINVYRPGMLILGGGVEASGDYFIEPIKKSIAKLALEELYEKVDITYSGIKDEDAVAAGAAALVIREFFMGV